ncbi:hypothetical protein ACJIZ3_021587 [Penstemon smallii]|uniref:Ubiquitin-like protease family profile domain-containing protein n=1 Tax=Penstemon smallii TaxID=265156 RepID=A0ABD3SMK3_9LAMI
MTSKKTRKTSSTAQDGPSKKKGFKKSKNHSSENTPFKRFQTRKGTNLFKKYTCKKEIIMEAGFDMRDETQPGYKAIEARGWTKFCSPPTLEGFRGMVQEFYVNFKNMNIETKSDIETKSVKVRGIDVPISEDLINEYYGLDVYKDGYQDEYTTLCQSHIDMEEVIKVICKEQPKWIDSEKTLFKVGSLKKESCNPWFKFVISRFLPKIQISTVTMDRALLVYCIVTGKKINVGKVIYGSMEKVSKSNAVSLYFPSLITDFCIRAGVPREENESVIYKKMMINLPEVLDTCSKRGSKDNLEDVQRQIDESRAGFDNFCWETISKIRQLEDESCSYNLRVRAIYSELLELEKAKVLQIHPDPSGHGQVINITENDDMGWYLDSECDAPMGTRVDKPHALNSSDVTRKLDYILDQENKGEIMVQIQEEHATGCAMRSIFGTEWLHAEILNLCVSIERRMHQTFNKGEVHFWYLPTYYSQAILGDSENLINMLKIYEDAMKFCEKIFVPMHENNCHWYAIVIDFKKRKVLILDSYWSDRKIYDDERLKAVENVVHFSHTLFTKHFSKHYEHNLDSFTIEPASWIPYQGNGNDCGIWVIKFMQNLHDLNILKYMEFNSAEERRSLARRLFYDEDNQVRRSILLKILRKKGEYLI